MTSLLSGPRSTPIDAPDPASRRPLALIAVLGGATAAAAPLLVCLALGVVGWFVSDAGAHGAPRDGLRVGALGWLMAHGSGVHVRGVTITAVPLGVTLVCAWVTWRLGLRVGESVSGHGPDSAAIADGERDWTVPAAVTLFGAGYAVVAVVTTVLAATPATSPSLSRVLLWVVGLSLLVALPAISVGSGRAAIWVAVVPVPVRAAVSTGLRILGVVLAVSALTLLVALVRHFGDAANVLSRLGTDAGDSTLFSLVTLGLVPNATVFTGSYLLGPGFMLGTATLVSPSVVSLGSLPAFPLLAALPDNGPAPAWVVALMGLPVLAAAVASARTHRRFPTLRWDEGALRGCVGGVLAGVGFAVLALLAGGSVGPGRMQDVSPYVFDVLVHGIAALGVGGLLGGLFMTWRERRHAAFSDADLDQD